VASALGILLERGQAFSWCTQLAVGRWLPAVPVGSCGEMPDPGMDAGARKNLSSRPYVVRAVQAFTVVVAGDRLDRAIGRRAGDAAIGVFAGDEPPVSVKGVAIGLPARCAEDLMAFGLRPPVQGIARDIAEDEASVATVLDGTFRERKACRDFLGWFVGLDDCHQSHALLLLSVAGSAATG
jgi:hypothetical protein